MDAMLLPGAMKGMNEAKDAMARTSDEAKRTLGQEGMISLNRVSESEA
jgi:hypothetical protein